MKRLAGFLARYFGWLFLASLSVLSGTLVVMLFRDWTLSALFATATAWPLMGLAMLAAVPIALIGLGRIYFYSALAGGLLYSLILAFV